MTINDVTPSSGILLLTTIGDFDLDIFLVRRKWLRRGTGAIGLMGSFGVTSGDGDSSPWQGIRYVGVGGVTWRCLPRGPTA